MIQRLLCIPILLASTSGALAADESRWHLDAPSLESILRDGTTNSADSFGVPGFKGPSVPINVPQSDVPSPGVPVLLLIAGIRAASRRSR